MQKKKSFFLFRKQRILCSISELLPDQPLRNSKNSMAPIKSPVMNRFEKLVQSLEFREKMKTKEFKGSEDDKKLQEFNRLKGSSEIKDYYTFKKSKEYANFLNTDGSTRLARYNELKDYVASAEFKEKKNYLLDKKRFEKTKCSNSCWNSTS